MSRERIIIFLFVRDLEEEVTIQESSKEVKESNEEVYWSGDAKKKSLKNLKSRGSNSNLENFLESVYSNLKKSYKLLTSFLLKTFQGISRETCCGKIFLDFNFLNSML